MDLIDTILTPTGVAAFDRIELHTWRLEGFEPGQIAVKRYDSEQTLQDEWEEGVQALIASVKARRQRGDRA